MTSNKESNISSVFFYEEFKNFLIYFLTYFGEYLF